MVVPFAVVLFVAGNASGTFAVIHDAIRSSPASAGWAEGFLIVAASQRRRGRADRRRRTDAEARYRTMIEHAPVVVYSWDHTPGPGESVMSYISPQIERLVGFAPQRWLEDPALWRSRVHPDDLDD